MKSFSLNGEWRLSGRDLCGTDEVTLVGRVPGCVQLDLSREGYLPEDLYMGLNILETERERGIKRSHKVRDENIAVRRIAGH